MKTALFVLGLLGAAIAIVPSAQAQSNYPWCARYGNGFSGTNCGFTTFRTMHGDGARHRRLLSEERLVSAVGCAAPQYSARNTERSQSNFSPVRRPRLRASVTRRSICAAISMLCVAMMAARPEARTN